MTPMYHAESIYWLDIPPKSCLSAWSFGCLQWENDFIKKYALMKEITILIFTIKFTTSFNHWYYIQHSMVGSKYLQWMSYKLQHSLFVFSSYGYWGAGSLHLRWCERSSRQSRPLKDHTGWGRLVTLHQIHTEGPFGRHWQHGSHQWTEWCQTEGGNLWIHGNMVPKCLIDQQI